MFSIISYWQWPHVFLRLASATYFPPLGASYTFSRAWHRLHLTMFLVTRKRKASVFKFFGFGERFRKAPFSWRISVDGSPNFRNRYAFSNFSGEEWALSQTHWDKSTRKYLYCWRERPVKPDCCFIWRIKIDPSKPQNAFKSGSKLAASRRVNPWITTGGEKRQKGGEKPA